MSATDLGESIVMARDAHNQINLEPVDKDATDTYSVPHTSRR